MIKRIRPDPKLWDDFILNATNRGHEVICLTMRHEHEFVEFSKWVKVKAYYTSRKAKKVWADENGIKVDIWIDDRPAWLFEDSL